MTTKGIAAGKLRDHFDNKYRSQDDPWGYRDSWYEQRKYAITIASLTQEKYEHCWEPACSIGELTALLAKRCNHIDASDISEQAIDAAKQRLKDTTNVQLSIAALPYQPPAEKYDLVVLSEILYYLERNNFDEVMHTAHASLAPEGELVVVHWRAHPDDAWVSGESANGLIRQDIQWQTAATHMDEHFVLDVFRKTT